MFCQCMSLIVYVCMFISRLVVASLAPHLSLCQAIACILEFGKLTLPRGGSDHWRLQRSHLEERHLCEQSLYHCGIIRLFDELDGVHNHVRRIRYSSHCALPLAGSGHPRSSSTADTSRSFVSTLRLCLVNPIDLDHPTFIGSGARFPLAPSSPSTFGFSPYRPVPYPIDRRNEALRPIKRAPLPPPQRELKDPTFVGPRP